MTKPSEKDIQEATEWVDKEIARARLVSRDEFLDDRFIPAPILRTIRTALEEYGKPRERWECPFCGGRFDRMYQPHNCVGGFRKRGFHKEQGIEITGPSPDNISKEVNNGS